MRDEDIDTGAPAPAAPAGRARIERIAEVLGCPVEAFTAPAGAETPIQQTAELVRLWLDLHDPESRLAVLAHLRGIVARQKRD